MRAIREYILIVSLCAIVSITIDFLFSVFDFQKSGGFISHRANALVSGFVVGSMLYFMVRQRGRRRTTRKL